MSIQKCSSCGKIIEPIVNKEKKILVNNMFSFNVKHSASSFLKDYELQQNSKVFIICENPDCKKWNTLSPQEKLKLCNVAKLKILARNKNLKGYSKYKKHELLNLLTPMVTNNDFPIV